jgi:mannosylglycoprotein endo-beta-mannosidase
MAPILEREITHALKSMKNTTAPGIDGVTAEALKLAGKELTRPLCRLFNNILSQGRIPEGFADSKTILLYKKADPQLISNYRPISLLSTAYKLFRRVRTNRLEPLLNGAQPSVQAGFRRGFLTADFLTNAQIRISRRK